MAIEPGDVIEGDFGSLGSVGAFYSNEGFLPLGLLDKFRESPWMWSVHAWSGSSAWEAALLFLHIAAAGCLLAGYRTQLAVLVCWALLCSVDFPLPRARRGSTWAASAVGVGAIDSDSDSAVAVP